MKKILISSGKGGVGKSTISVGLARALRDLGYKIGLCDSDFTMPDVLIMLGNPKAKPILSKDRTLVPLVLEEIKVISWGSLWREGSAITIEDRQIDEDDLRMVINLIKSDRSDKAIRYLEELIENPGGATYYMKQMFEDGVIEWGDIDWLVIDSAPTTSGTVRVLTEIGLYGSVLVTQPTNASLSDVSRTIDMFRKRGVPIIGLVCNMSDRFELNEEEVRQFSENNGVPYIESVPFSENLNGYFTSIATYLTNNEPVTLQQKGVGDEWKKTLKELGKLSDLIQTLRGN